MRAAAEALRATIPDATDDALLDGLVHLAALVSAGGRDAHTGIYPWGSGSREAHSLPLRLWAFPEGIAVVDALPPYESLVGMVLTSIDGRSVTDVRAALEPLIPRDNDETVTLLLPRFLLTTEILHGAGLLANVDTASLAFAGDPEPVTVDAIPMTEYNAWATPYGLHLPDDPAVPYLARAEEPIWTRVDGGTTLYVQYNRVTRLGAAAQDAVRAAIADPAIRRVVVDVRHNYGGETSGFPWLVDALVAAADDLPGGIAVLTGRNTFSAATLFVTELQAATAITIVGEPMGGSPSLYGNARDVRLPFSGLVANIATQFYEPVVGETRLQVDPDVAVALTLADWLAGRDPVLTAAER